MDRRRGPEMRIERRGDVPDEGAGLGRDAEDITVALDQAVEHQGPQPR